MESKVSVSKLVDVADIVDSLHKTPKYSPLGYPMVRCVDLGYGPLSLSNTKSVSEEIYAEYSRRYEPAKGDIIITRVGANFGVTSYVEETNFCLGQNTAAIIPKINPNYLYYILNSAKCRHQMSVLVAGAAQPTLSLKAIKALDIPRLGSEVEDEIADIIGNINDKISINKQTNQTLEKMAQTLFKSWFVDFDPVFDNALAKADFNLENLPSAWPGALVQRATLRLQVLQDNPTLKAKLLQHNQAETENNTAPTRASQAENTYYHFPSEFELIDEPSIGINGWIPKGWKLKNLSELLDIKYGKDHKKLNEGNYSVYGSGGLMRNVDEFLYEGESVLIPRKGTLSNIMYVNEKFWTVDTMFFTKPKMNNVAKFAFYLLKRLDFNNMNVGSAVPSMTTKVLNALQIVCPSENVLAEFDELVELYFSKIRANNENSINLEMLRDTLLPKLIAGEVQL